MSIARLPRSSSNVGKTLYGVFRNADQEPYNNSGASAGTFEAYNAASWADYKVTATEEGGVGASGGFTLTVPDAVDDLSAWNLDWFEDTGADHLDPVRGIAAKTPTDLSSQNIPPIAGSAGTITVVLARLWVRANAHNAKDSTVYDDTDIDRAIQTVGGRFARETRCIRGFETVDLTDGDADVDFSGIGDFRPDRLLAAYASGYEEPLELLDYASLRRQSIVDPSEGIIEAIAFKDADSAVVWRLPDSARTLDVEYWRPFSAWTPGTDPGGVLNLPDDYLHPILVFGAPAVLQHTEAEKLYASSSWKEYLRWEQEMKNVGNLAAKVSRRTMSSW